MTTKKRPGPPFRTGILVTAAEDKKVPATHAADPDPHPYLMRAGVSHAYLANIEFLRSHVPQAVGFDRTIL